MSSFVIDKKEYIKAAGIVAGVASASRDFWVYDYVEHHNSTAEDFYNRFCDVYRLNALSVQEQYNDPEPEADTNSYKAVFNQYMKYGRQYYFKGMKTALIELKDFFRSAIYQIENEEYARKTELYFSRIIDALIDKCFPHECRSWGTLELDPVEETIVTII